MNTAQKTATHHAHDPDCLFCKIAQGQIPSKKVYEDEMLLAFDDIHPLAPIHFLLIPKRHLASLMHVSEVDAPLLARMMLLIPQLALQQGCAPYPQGGFRLMCNTGEIGGQEVQHLHLHVLGGPHPWRKEMLHP